jgi:cell pole-organizing protein PopZ
MVDTGSNDPSMEDILASIKRIIADDGAAAPGGVKVETLHGEGPDPLEDVLELTEQVVVPEAAAAVEPPPIPVPGKASGLISDRTTQAARHALASLSTLVVRPDAPPETLDGMVREMIRPMLHEWLEARLPELVEQMVAREIERITGRMA